MNAASSYHNLYPSHTSNDAREPLTNPYQTESSAQYNPNAAPFAASQQQHPSPQSPLNSNQPTQVSSVLSHLPLISSNPAALIYYSGPRSSWFKFGMFLLLALSVAVTAIGCALFGAYLNGSFESGHIPYVRGSFALAWLAFSTLYSAFLAIYCLLVILMPLRFVPIAELTPEQRSTESGFEPLKFASANPDTPVPMRRRSPSASLLYAFMVINILAIFASIPESLLSLPLVIMIDVGVYIFMQSGTCDPIYSRRVNWSPQLDEVVLRETPVSANHQTFV